MKYKLLIKTNSYAGNFERELAAYVFGFYWNCQDWIDDLASKFEMEADGDFQNWIDDSLIAFYDEHGQTCCRIEGGNNLSFEFDKNPSEYIGIIKQRLEKFPEVLAQTWEYAPKDVKILGVEVYKIEIKESKKKIK